MSGLTLAVGRPEAASEAFTRLMVRGAQFVPDVDEVSSASTTPDSDDHLCVVCHKAPRFRKNAQTCRTVACRAAWKRRRQARNSHTYRVRMVEVENGGGEVVDPAEWAELAERARRSVSRNPMTRPYPYPLPLLTEDLKKLKKFVSRSSKDDTPSEEQDERLHKDETDSLDFGRQKHQEDRPFPDDSVSLWRPGSSPFPVLLPSESLAERGATPLDSPPSRVSARAVTPPARLSSPHVCDSALDSLHPLAYRLRWLATEVSLLTRERDRTTEALYANDWLRALGADVLQAAHLALDCDRTWIRRLEALDPGLVHRLACALHRVSEVLRDVTEADRWQRSGWGVSTVLAWNNEHPDRPIEDLPFPISPLALVLRADYARLLERAGLVLFKWACFLAQRRDDTDNAPGVPAKAAAPPRVLFGSCAAPQVQREASRILGREKILGDEPSEESAPDAECPHAGREAQPEWVAEQASVAARQDAEHAEAQSSPSVWHAYVVADERTTPPVAVLMYSQILGAKPTGPPCGNLGREIGRAPPAVHHRVALTAFGDRREEGSVVRNGIDSRMAG